MEINAWLQISINVILALIFYIKKYFIKQEISCIFLLIL